MNEIDVEETNFGGDNNVLTGRCTTCSGIEICEGINGNAYVLGQDTNFNYDIYIFSSGVNCE